jgi:hypothetical protein
LYALLFILLNNRRLEVNFVFFKLRSRELVALIVILACGFAAGYFFHEKRHPTAPGQTPPGPPDPAPTDQADR